jgi:chaperone required for assembly of F1-ATPase
LKRFFKQVDVMERDACFAVTLDGKPVRTPRKAELLLPTNALARAVADEWAAQEKDIRPHAMPLTRLANAATDRVAHHRAGVIDALVAYGGSDLVCYRAAAPDDLVARQNATWQPLIDWMAQGLGVALCTTTELTPVDQPPELAPALRKVIDGFDDFRLMGLHAACVAAGSIVIALALAEGRLDAAQAWHAADLDSAYQIEKWGLDSDAETRRDGLRRDFDAAASFMTMARRE